MLQSEVQATGRPFDKRLAQHIIATSLLLICFRFRTAVAATAAAVRIRTKAAAATEILQAGVKNPKPPGSDLHGAAASNDIGHFV